MPADGLRQSTYHALFGADRGDRHSEAMGLERDGVDLDAGELSVFEEGVIAGPNAVRSMRAPRENTSEWIEVLATIVPVERQSRQAISDEDR